MKDFYLNEMRILFQKVAKIKYFSVRIIFGNPAGIVITLFKSTFKSFFCDFFRVILALDK
jgi:hypothetical protein